MTKTSTIRPTADYVLVKARPPEEKTDGGLIIPETARDGRSIFAEVLAVGPGRWLEEAQKRQESELRPGDVAVLVRWGVNRFEIDGEDLLLIRESEILGVVEAP